jgi:hypothetical protein
MKELKQLTKLSKEEKYLKKYKEKAITKAIDLTRVGIYSF